MKQTAVDPRFAEVGCLFFGIGAQKAGTTWLHDYLKGHPEAKVPEVNKELHYWNTVRPPHTRFYLDRLRDRARRRRLKTFAIRLFGSEAKRRRDRGRELWQAALEGRDDGHRAYADVLFSHRGQETTVGEITPEYALLGTETFREMAALTDRSRFIFIMRDPLDRVLSSLRFWLRKQGKVPTDANLSEHLALSLDGDPEEVFARSRYEETIAQLEAAVPHERISYHFYETLFEQAEIDRLTTFLGLTPWQAELEKRVHDGIGKGATADTLLVARARRRLQPTYDFVTERFGAAVPAAWCG